MSFHNFNNLLKIEPWKTWLTLTEAKRVVVNNRFECAVRDNVLYTGSTFRVGLSAPGIVPRDTAEYLLQRVRKTLSESLNLVPAHYGKHPLNRHSLVLADKKVMYRYEWIRDCRDGTYILIPYAEQVKILIRAVDGQCFSADVLVCGRVDLFVGDPRTMKEDSDA